MSADRPLIRLTLQKWDGTKKLAIKKWQCYLCQKKIIANRLINQPKLYQTYLQLAQKKHDDEVRFIREHGQGSLLSEIYKMYDGMPLMPNIDKVQPKWFLDQFFSQKRLFSLAKFIVRLSTIKQRLLDNAFPLIRDAANDLNIEAIEILKLAVEHNDFCVAVSLPSNNKTKLFNKYLEQDVRSLGVNSSGPNMLCLSPEYGKILLETGAVEMMFCRKGYDYTYVSSNHQRFPDTITTKVRILSDSREERDCIWIFSDKNDRLNVKVTLDNLRIIRTQFQTISHIASIFPRKKPWLKQDSDTPKGEWELATEYKAREVMKREPNIQLKNLIASIEIFLQSKAIMLDRYRRYPSPAAIKRRLNKKDSVWRNRHKTK